MKANELRIGNLIKFSEDGTIFTVGSIEEKGFTVQNDEETTWIEAEEFEPIPITEEWLLKLGFERDNQGNWKLKSGYHWIELYFYHVYINGQQVVLIDYVHQLQNIWFALTGKELTYGGNK
jgi:hypothetical protein